MKNTMFAAVAAMIVSASAAAAGGVVEPVAEPAIVAVVPDWTGFYAGAQLGRVDSDIFGENGGGVFVGYRYDLGSVVVGGEAAYNAGNQLETTALKAQLGYDAGLLLPYVTVGYANVNAVGSGTVYGVGADYLVADSITIGAEWLGSTIKVDNADVNGNAFTVRVAYAF